MEREILKEKSFGKCEVQDSYISLINDINMLDTVKEYKRQSKNQLNNKENIPNNISPTEDISTQLSHINLSNMFIWKKNAKIRTKKRRSKSFSNAVANEEI